MWTADGLDLDRYLVPRYPIPLPLARGLLLGALLLLQYFLPDVRHLPDPSDRQALEDLRAAIRETGSNWFDLPVDSYRPRELHDLATAIIDSGLEVEWGAEVLLDPAFKDERHGRPGQVRLPHPALSAWRAPRSRP